MSEASWGVALPRAPEGWPTQAAIDEEIAFVRSVRARELGLSAESGSMALPWGSVWSQFDLKGGLAAHGLRYGRG